MITSSDLPKSLPLFQLPKALLLPKMRMPLHIYEPQYLALVEDVLRTPKRLLGIIRPTRDKPHEVQSENKIHLKNNTLNLYQVGCAGRIISFTETPDGRYMITLAGISRFEVDAIQADDTPYLCADVDWRSFSDDLEKTKRDSRLDRDAFLSLLYRYFANEALDADWEHLQTCEDELLINSISTLCPFGNDDKQALLEAGSLAERLNILMTLMEYALRKGTGEEKIQ